MPDSDGNPSLRRAEDALSAGVAKPLCCLLPCPLGSAVLADEQPAPQFGTEIGAFGRNLNGLASGFTSQPAIQLFRERRTCLIYPS